MLLPLEPLTGIADPVLCCHMQILDVGREIKAKGANAKTLKSDIPQRSRSNTHLWEVGHVSQGSDLKSMQKFRKVFEDVVSFGKQVAESRDDIQQGPEHSTSFRRYQHLKGSNTAQN